MTVIVSPDEARLLLARGKRSRKRKEQLALDLALSWTTPTELYLGGVVHPPINEWKAWHWTRYNEEKAKWEQWILALSRGMARWSSPVRVVVTSNFADGRRHDPDGYSPKFIMDPLVKAGVIPDDSLLWVRSIEILCRRADRYGTLVAIAPAVE